MTLHQTCLIFIPHLLSKILGKFSTHMSMAPSNNIVNIILKN